MIIVFIYNASMWIAAFALLASLALVTLAARWVCLR